MSIDPTTLDGLTLSLTGSVFQGPEGPQGKDGKAGANGTPGKSVEFQATPTYIQWRYVGDTLWNNLIAVASLTGPAGHDGVGIKGDPGTDGQNGTDGQDGREIELQKTTTYLQWRYVGATQWTNLVALSELKGEKGDPGQSFSPNVTAAFASRSQYDNEDPGFAFLAIDQGMIYFRLDPSGWSNGMPFGKGEKGDKGDPGNPGQDGTNGANGADGRGIASTTITYQNGASSTVAPTGTWTAAVPATVKGQYLWTRAVITYTDATTSTLYSVAYQGQDGTGGGSGTNVLLLTATPTAAQGTEGAVALVLTSNGYISTYLRGTSVWTKVWEQPLANSTQAKAASSSTIPTTPAGVREYLEQYGLTSTYTTAPANLNTIVNGGFFNWGTTTVNAPLAGSYGRGICIPSGSGYVTQWSIENTTGKMHARYQENGTWTAWIEVGAGSGGTGGGLPAGGTAGQVLTKQSATDGDADWEDPSGGGGGGGDSAFKRAMAPSNVVIQSLNPVTIVSVALDGASAYHIQFKGTLNDNASSAGLKVCVGSIDKREMALRVSYRDSTGALITKKILEGGVDNGVTFSGSEANGPGNLLTIDGYILTGNTNATTPFVVQLCNADAQWDYRQMTQGASISAEKMGTITLS